MQKFVPIKMYITKLDIFESYFKGKAELGDKSYTVNLQPEKRGKVLKLPFNGKPESKILVRLSGPNGIYAEDYLPFCGESEWIEIDSTEITYFSADHQDNFDTLEIFSK